MPNASWAAPSRTPPRESCAAPPLQFRLNHFVVMLAGMTARKKTPPLGEIFRDPRLALMLALGFSSGLPFLLTP